MALSATDCTPLALIPMVVAVGSRIQGWLNGRLLLDQHDERFRAGRVGVWTKADSITAFDDLTIRGVLSPA